MVVDEALQILGGMGYMRVRYGNVCVNNGDNLEKHLL